MKNIFQKFLTSKKNRKITIGNQNEFAGIIAPVSPIAVVDEPVTFSSDVDFTNANVIGINTSPDTSNLWSLDGNVATSGDFIGTTNNIPLVLKTNNTNVAIFPIQNTDNIVVGKQSFAAQQLNVVIGNVSNTNSNGTRNVLIGGDIQNIGQNITGGASENVILGHSAARKNRSNRNVILGEEAAKEIQLNSPNNVILGNDTANFTANASDVFTTYTTNDVNWSSITYNSWETTGPVTDIITSNVYNPQSFIQKIQYTAGFNCVINSGSISVYVIDNTGVTPIFTQSTSANFTIDFEASGNVTIEIVPNNNFSGSFNIEVVHATVDVISNSVIIGREVKPKDNKDTNEIAIGYQVEGNGSNTVTLGNNSITNTYLKGALQLPTYGDGAVTGTPTRLLAVNTDGKVIETALVSPRPYTVYTANLNQTSTSNPTTVIFENTIGNIVWTRVAGVDLEENPFIYFEGTLTGAFVTNKTVAALLNKGNGAGPTNMQVVNNNVIRIFTNNLDSVLSNTTIEIRVYS